MTTRFNKDELLEYIQATDTDYADFHYDLRNIVGELKAFGYKKAEDDSVFLDSIIARHKTAKNYYPILLDAEGSTAFSSGQFTEESVRTYIESTFPDHAEFDYNDARIVELLESIDIPADDSDWYIGWAFERERQHRATRLIAFRLHASLRNPSDWGQDDYRVVASNTGHASFNVVEES